MSRISRDTVKRRGVCLKASRVGGKHKQRTRRSEVDIQGTYGVTEVWCEDALQGKSGRQTGADHRRQGATEGF